MDEWHEMSSPKILRLGTKTTRKQQEERFKRKPPPPQQTATTAAANAQLNSNAAANKN